MGKYTGCILDLCDPNIRKIVRTSDQIKGRLRLGRGYFCAVYDTPNPATVMKLTLDKISVQYLTDTQAPNGTYKPEVIKDYGVVGESNYGFPIHLLEVEKLHKIDRYAPNSRIVSYISSCQRNWALLPDKIDDEKKMTKPLIDFMAQLSNFIERTGCEPDLHVSNFMERENGTLVFSDPVCDRAGIDRHTAMKQKAFYERFDKDIA